MAKAQLLAQPFSEQTFSEALGGMFSGDGVQKIIISSAYANENGVDQIASALGATSAVKEAYIGVRNGVTTAQSISRLMAEDVDVYCVDTASAACLYHPKVYCTLGKGWAKMLLGSANCTFSGLMNNIETCILLDLDFELEEDYKVYSDYVEFCESLRERYPQNCFRITSTRQLIGMIRSGLIIDSRFQREWRGMGVAKPGAQDETPRIGLKFHYPRARSSGHQKVVGGQSCNLSAAIAPIPVKGGVVWVKKNLPSGDLQLLNTRGHATGVLRLTQAGYRIDGRTIDQTTYFRDCVFADLEWHSDERTPSKEIAWADFEIIVKGVARGKYRLKVGHNPQWEAGQNNYTTGLHWGDARETIQHESLIGGTLSMYAPAGPGLPYVLELDSD